jgi:hypothetical protein
LAGDAGGDARIPISSGWILRAQSGDGRASAAAEIGLLPLTNPEVSTDRGFQIERERRAALQNLPLHHLQSALELSQTVSDGETRIAERALCLDSTCVEW